MSKRRIVIHLALLAILICAGIGLYVFMTGRMSASFWTDALDSKDNKTGLVAAQRLESIGTAAVGSAPKLLNMALSGPSLNNRSSAARALLWIDLQTASTAASEAISVFLNSRDSNERYRALQVIEALSPLSTDVAPDLIAVVRDKSQPSIVRRYALSAVIEMMEPKRDVIALIGEELSDPDESVRYEAILNVGMARDPVFKDILGDIKLAIENVNASGQTQYLGLLMQAERAAAMRQTAFLDVYIYQINGIFNDRQGLEYTLKQLKLLGPMAQKAVPSIAKLLNDERPYIRLLAADALAEIGPAAKSALPALDAALNDGDPVVRKHVESARSIIRGNQNER